MEINNKKEQYAASSNYQLQNFAMSTVEAQAYDLKMLEMQVQIVHA